MVGMDVQKEMLVHELIRRWLESFKGRKYHMGEIGERGDVWENKKNESARERQRMACLITSIPSFQFQQDLATSFLNSSLLRTSQ